jgi:hypothetical protein
MAEIERLMNEELDRVTKEDWASHVRHEEIYNGRFCKRNRTKINYRAHRYKFTRQ